MNAEYIGPSQELLERAKILWAAPGSLQLIRGNENWVYSQDGSDLIFRFTANYHRSEQKLLAELEWVYFLKQNNCRVVSTVESTQRKLVHALSEMWCVVVFKKMDGRALTNADDFSPELIYNWGRTIGRLHVCTKKYQPTSSFLRRDWDKDDGFELAQQMLSVVGSDHAVVKIFLNCVEQIRKLPKNTETFGLIHADIHHGNFFVTDDKDLTIFDFDDAIYAYFLFDLAVPLEMMEICYRSGRWNKNLRIHQKEFLNGYTSENTIPDITPELLELFVRYRCAHLFLWGASRIHLKRTNDVPGMKKMMDACEEYLTQAST